MPTRPVFFSSEGAQVVQVPNLLAPEADNRTHSIAESLSSSPLGPHEFGVVMGMNGRAASSAELTEMGLHGRGA